MYVKKFAVLIFGLVNRTGLHIFFKLFHHFNENIIDNSSSSSTFFLIYSKNKNYCSGKSDFEISMTMASIANKVKQALALRNAYANEIKSLLSSC